MGCGEYGDGQVERAPWGLKQENNANHNKGLAQVCRSSPGSSATPQNVRNTSYKLCLLCHKLLVQNPCTMQVGSADEQSQTRLLKA